MRTYDLLRKSVRPKVSGRRALMFLGKPRNARQGFPLHSRFLESVSAGLRVSRLDSENTEASNGRPPTSRNAGPLKNGGLCCGWDGGSCQDGL